GKIEGKEFEGGSAQDYSLELGSKTLFPEFETSIAGMKKGEKKQISLLLPENIEKRDITGKKADFDILVKEIKKRVLPELDKEFIKNLGEYEEVEDFTSEFKQRLEEQKKGQRQSQIIGQIIDHIANNMKEEIPAPMVESRVTKIESEVNEGLKKQNMSKENYMNALNIDEEKFNSQIKERAEKEVREYLIFTALDKSEASNIKATEEEIANEKEDILSRYDKDEEKKKISEYFDKPEAVMQISETVKRKKLLDQLERNVKVIEEAPKADKIDDKKKIWTPEEEKAEKKNETLWTPDSKESKSEDKVEGDDKNE
ncbi:MAG: trigger factor, partial [Candidatus Humimicrobiaceae bacterium]